ncbi:MAG: hypothetical protein HYY29_02060, partial [Chloroflexi bacterium]|nr:hypothetical protein [Chloroflexota bacterium]
MPNMLAHLVEGRTLWASSNNILYRSDDGGKTFNKVAEVPGPPLIRLLARCRLSQRALRLGIRSIKKLKSGTILAVANKKLFRLDDGGFEPAYSFRRGFGPLRQGWCEDDRGNCFISEYFLNNRRDAPVRLSKSSDDGRTWAPVHSFPSVRHIHLVQFDPYTGTIWVGTGDRNNESSISFSRDGGVTWTAIGAGDQIFRAVSLIHTQDFVYWGTDAPTRQNHIYRYCRGAGTVERLAPVSGPVHYSTVLKNGVKLFGSAAEGKSEGFSAAWDNKAHIWASVNGTDWEDLVSWQKDFWPYILG